jgi:hypothetical protein
VERRWCRAVEVDEGVGSIEHEAGRIGRGRRSEGKLSTDPLDLKLWILDHDVPKPRDVRLDVPLDLWVLIGHPDGDDLVIPTLLHLPAREPVRLVCIENLDPLDGEALVLALVEGGRVRWPVDAHEDEDHGDAADFERTERVSRRFRLPVGAMRVFCVGVGHGEEEELTELGFSVEVGLGDKGRARDIVWTGEARGGGEGGSEGSGR